MIPADGPATQRRQARQEWFQTVLTTLREIDLVFVDPDNGLLLTLIMMPAPGQSASPVARDWDGTYTCIQGPTALHLTIKPLSDGRLSAVFNFYSLPSNPRVPSGSFQMNGTFNPSTQRVILSPGDWLSRPLGFTTVGLDGTLDCKADHFSGKVTGGTFCTVFDLSRTKSSPSNVGPCDGHSALVATR